MKRVKRYVAMLLIAAITITSTRVEILAENNTETVIESEVNNEVQSEKPADEGETQEALEQEWDGVTTESVYDGEGYKVYFTIVSSWESGYNAKIKIENTGDEEIDNWMLQFLYPDEISGIWNGTIESFEDGKYVIKNDGWNASIKPQSSVEFGFGSNISFKQFPSSCELVGKSTQHNEDEYEVEYKLESDWGSGFSAAIYIQNNTDEDINGWRLEFDYDRLITNIWDAEIESHEGKHYVIKCVDYNSAIKAQQKLQFGFNGKEGTSDCEPSNIRFYSFQYDRNKYVQLEDGLIEKDYLEKAIYPNLILRDMSIDNVKLSDDYDGDGLTLEEEYENDTNPFLKDTDEDGISDYDEVNIYKTSPVDEDTDGDNMTDGTEIGSGLDPFVKDSDGNGVTDDQEVVLQNINFKSLDETVFENEDTLPSIQITGKGDYRNKIHAISLLNDQGITAIDSLVGTPYEFEHPDDFSFNSCTLSFTVNDEILKEYELDDLAIGYYDDTNNSLQLLKTEYDEASHKISAEVDHFSIYMVVSSSEYFHDINFCNEEAILSAGKADVVFAIDTTGSMKKSIDNVKDNIKDFTDELTNQNIDVRFGLVEFKDIYFDGTDSTRDYGWYKMLRVFKRN